MMNYHRLPLLAAFLAACLLAATTGVRAEQLDSRSTQQFEAQLTNAMKGDAEAQYRIGEMYENGHGTNRDMAMAYLWYNKSAFQGNPRAREKIAALDKSKTGSAEEQARVNAAMRALQQQSAQEATRQREKDKAATDARARQQTEETARAQKAAAEAARARTVTPVPATAVAPVAKPAAPAGRPADPRSATAGPEVAKPAATVTKPAEPAKTPPPTAKDSGNTEFSANPCKGPQAKFLSTCN